MEYINDFISVYEKAMKDSMKIIMKVPLVLLMALIFHAINQLVNFIFLKLNIGVSGFLLGFIIVIIEAMILSAYFSILDDAIHLSRFSLKGLKSDFVRFASSIYAVKFVFFIVAMFFGNILNLLPVTLVVFLLLNPLGEAIYIGNRYGLEAIIYAFNYWKDNWYLWLPHVIIFVLVSEVLGIYFVANPLDLYLKPVFFIDFNMIIYLIFVGFYAIFRGVLFRNTKDSSLRKRKYMGVWQWFTKKLFLKN